MEEILHNSGDRELESILLDYIAKYGLSERARSFFCSQIEEEQRDAHAKPCRPPNLDQSP